MIAFLFLQERELFFFFDALADHFQIEAMGHGDDRHGDRRVARIGGDIAYERLIELERVDRKTLQIVER